MPNQITQAATVIVSDRIQATGTLISRHEDGTATILHVGKHGRKTAVTGELVWLGAGQ